MLKGPFENSVLPDEGGNSDSSSRQINDLLQKRQTKQNGISGQTWMGMDFFCPEPALEELLDPDPDDTDPAKTRLAWII